MQTDQYADILEGPGYNFFTCRPPGVFGGTCHIFGNGSSCCYERALSRSQLANLWGGAFQAGF